MARQMLMALLITLPLVAVVSPVCAGTQDKAKPGNGPRDRSTKYDVLLESLLRRVESRDPSLRDGAASKAFKELRFAYAETPRYNPYGGIKAEVGPVMWEAVAKKNYDQAIRYAETILKENFVDIDAQMVASMMYEKTGNQEKAEYHEIIASGLILSILDDGDGSAPGTAMEVISTDEEYAMLNFLGFRAKSQATLQAHGHNYDKLTVVDPASRKRLEIYFCIDTPFTRLQDSFKVPHERRGMDEGAESLRWREARAFIFTMPTACARVADIAPGDSLMVRYRLG